MKYIWYPLMIICFFACDTPQPKKGGGQGEKIFRTTDPSRLYFRNIRSTHYYHERDVATDMDIYRLRRYSRTSKRPIVMPVIVNNWLQDEAYMLVEPNGYKGLADPLHIQVEKDTSIQPLVLSNPTKKGQYEFAAQLYSLLKDKESLEVKTEEGDFISIFNNMDDKNNFLTVMKDYYRLTESY
ncbi:MAG: hypothetical protein AAFV95_22410 [Bacteroidota bacterium]